MVCGWPTMPKRGAVMSTTRRSRSSRRPVISAWSGAVKPSARDIGRHVVHAAVGDRGSRRRRGRAARRPAPRRAPRTAACRRFRRRPGPPRRSALRGPGCAPSRSASAARAASVCAVRSPKFWLGLLSTTIAATEVSGSRSSRVNDGIGEREHEQRERDRAHRRAAAAHENSSDRDNERDGERRPHHIGRNQRRECDAEVHGQHAKVRTWPAREYVKDLLIARHHRDASLARRRDDDPVGRVARRRAGQRSRNPPEFRRSIAAWPPPFCRPSAGTRPRPAMVRAMRLLRTRLAISHAVIGDTCRFRSTIAVARFRRHFGAFRQPKHGAGVEKKITH